MGAEHRIDLVDEPGEMAKLDRRTPPPGKLPEKRIELHEIDLEGRRKLKHGWSQPSPQRVNDLEKVGERLVIVTQPMNMSDTAGGLHHKAEVFGNLLGPAGQHRFGRYAIERVVDLDRVEPLGIVRQHLCSGELRGIEAPSPFRIGPATGADERSHNGRCQSRADVAGLRGWGLGLVWGDFLI